MTKFKCKVCANHHQIYTLVESPKPEIFGKITSGVLDQSLDVIAKSLFVINREYGLFECELSIKLIDEEDSLDINIWLEFDGKLFFAKVMENEKVGKINLIGNLRGFIPFYKNNNVSKFVVEIDLDKNEPPKVTKVLNESELKEDFENGIYMSKLEAFMTQAYHPNRTSDQSEQNDKYDL